MGEFIAEPAILPRRHHRPDNREVRIARRKPREIRGEPVTHRRSHQPRRRVVQRHGHEIHWNMPRRQQCERPVKLRIQHR
jgi:hypothetical protein